VSLDDFVENVYLPRMKATLRFSTHCSYVTLWDRHLKAHCKNLWLREVRTHHLQMVLDHLAEADCLARCATCHRLPDQHRCTDHEPVLELTHNTLKHYKVPLSGIFKFAKQQGFYDGTNPAQDTAVPAGRQSVETYAYSLEEIAQMLTLLPESAATVVATCSYTGLRRGELRGLLWENYRQNDEGQWEMRVTRSLWHSAVSAAKTRASTGAVPIIQPLAERLELHRARLGWPTNGPIFPNDAGRPMDLNNLVVRVIVPALTRCAKCRKRRDEHRLVDDHKFVLDESLPKWHGFHACRRGLGSNLYRLGVPEKIIQAILRHANVAVTNTYYIKTAAADTHAAMQKLQKAVTEKPVRGGQPHKSAPLSSRTFESE